MPTKAEYAKNPEHHRAYNRNYLKKWRKENGYYEGERQLKQKARTTVGHAIKRGDMARGNCETEECSLIGEAHHDDYSKPLSVRWLCKEHHELAHKGV